MIYAKLKPVQLLNKTLDKLEVTVVNYALGTQKPVLGYRVVCLDGSNFSSDNIDLDSETYKQWTTNDDIVLQYVATKLGLEIDTIVKLGDKTSEDYLRENPNLETK
jgi:hypothetical protein